MRNFSRRRLVAGTWLAFTLAVAGADPVTLVGTNATWRYLKGTAEPTPADRAAWRSPVHSDSAWSEGRAPFWYGEAALFGGTGTPLTDMQNAYSTVYLRHRFSVANPAAFESLELRTRCDDGFIAWLNGKPLVNRNGPTGDPVFNALAAANAPEPVAPTSDLFGDPGSLLVPGDNLLAVQVFNISLGSSDLVFAAELLGVPRPEGPPAITTVTPTPGPVTALDRITVTFSEPVRGVRAEDFLVNGASATAVEGTGATYTFSFPPPPFGEIAISWGTLHTIEDFEDPPRRFELAAPGSTWGYELIDPDGPQVATRQPPAKGVAVRGLRQVEITFDKAVAGLDAGDLTLNGVAATNLTGFGAGPYRFEFPEIAAGPVTAAWREGHGIVSDSLEPHPFSGGSWNYTLDPGLAAPALAITEFMAENFTAYRDEDQDPEDWIEVHNPTTAAVNLEGWSLSNSADDPGRWTFPAVSLPARGYLVVFASGKDRRPATGARLHTNFRLNPNGDRIGLYPPELPRLAVSEVSFATQGPDYSYGRENDVGDWRYFKTGTPGAPNGVSPIRESVAEVHFSATRGYYNAPVQLYLHCPTPGSFIRFTTNGSPPTELEGFLYTNALPLTTTRVIRAAAFKTNALPSRVETHTYLFNQTGTRLRLPALSLVTATNHLYGRTGIMEVNPRNTTKRGAAWERPVSVEFIRVDDNGGFQAECGLRIQGGDYVRGQYNYRSTGLPFSKYSFRLYFRGEYGQGRLNYPLFPETTQTSFDTIVLRAGMNDHSNPYLLDEFVRTLARDCGQPSAVGTFVHLFLNGVYKGYYNPCERIDVDFLRAYHGGGEKWDLMAQTGEVREGDATAWNALRTLANTRDLSQRANYLDLAGRLDLTNFVDYLCPLIYVDNDDWPHNNWRAARERVPGGLYRMYVWDAEWSFGVVNGHAPTWNTINNQLSSTSPPWGGADIQRMFNGLKKSPEFRLLFADRVHRHFFNGGALTDERLRLRYAQLTNRLNGVVSGFDNRIGTTWIPQRRRYVLDHFQRAGFLASSNAPAFGRHGGRVPAGFALVITNLAGTIYYTTNGADPRIAFAGEVAAEARPYAAPLPLSSSVLLRARSLNGTNWSALTEAVFQVDRPDSPLRLTEIMYHPPGGGAFEFLEIANLDSVPLDVSGFSIPGLDFRFPEPSPPMPPGARWVLASDARPAEFAARYPAVTVAGWFSGSLNNSGEKLEVLDRQGRTVTMVNYDNTYPWPTGADGGGRSLELIDEAADPDPDNPASWQDSLTVGGTPGASNSRRPAPKVRLTELARPDPQHAWIEIANFGTDAVLLHGWSLRGDNADERYDFPASAATRLEPGTRLLVWSPTNSAAGTLSTGFSIRRTVGLYDPAGERADLVSVPFSTFLSGYSLGRLGDSLAWQLCEPTPQAANEPAPTAPVTGVTLNEWLANPPPGEPDWVELHNSDPTAPADLGGSFLATSNSLVRIEANTFIPPSGFVVLTSLTLPASGNQIELRDPTGALVDRVTYRAVTEGLTLGRFPEGSANIQPFPGSPSRGSSNLITRPLGPVLNEWMARNQGAVLDPTGQRSDWIELHNPHSATLDLAGLNLEIGDDFTWTFPAGLRLAPGGHLVLWCNATRPSSTTAALPLLLGRSLSGEGQTLRLVNAVGQVLDSATYGPQLPDHAVGRVAGGFALLAHPTPGTANAGPAALGNASSVRINEWLAGNEDGDDWLELFNPDPAPVDLGGHFLTDDPTLSGITRFALPPLSFVPGGGHGLWIADGEPGRGGDHLGFRLATAGEGIRLYLPNRNLVDAVDFGPRPPGVTQGRFPDGTAGLAFFPESASPETSNWLPHPGVVIHELLTHTDPPLEDAIELRNPSAQPVSLDGWWLSDDAGLLNKQRVRNGIVLPPGGLHVIYEYEFNPPGSPTAFTLNSARGGDLWLSEVDALGVLTGYRAHVRFEAAANASSLGLHRTSLGWDFAPLSRRTFGKDAPASLAEFRQGTGLPNAYPLLGPALLTELQVRPTVIQGTNLVEAPEDEFVEIHNPGRQPVLLFDPAAATNRWRLRGGIAFDFPPAAVLPAGGFALIVRFAETNTAQMAAFRTRYAVPAEVPLWGPFEGRLSDQGDEVRLERPDTPQAPPQPDAGYVPYLLVERVVYRTAYPWPNLSGASAGTLQRRRLAEYANDPANWILAPPSAGVPARPPLTDRDFDGMPNAWEIAHQLNPDDPADAGLDLDHDGLSNLAEYLAGTDPRDAASALRLSLGREASAGLVLRFRALAERAYTVLGRDDAVFGVWQRIADLPAETLDRELAVPLGTGNEGRQFYRVITPPLP